MKIRFLEDTYIRSAPSTVSGQKIGFMYQGSEIDVEPTPISGEAIEGNNLWYYDKKGWYYWSGRTETLEVQGQDTTAWAWDAQASVSFPVIEAVPIVEGGERIPEGETRLAPPLENLLMAEEVFQALLNPAEDTSTRGFGPPLPSAEERSLDDPFSGKPISPEEPSAVFRQPIDHQRLNWAIQKYKLHQDWWKDRRLTGEKTRIALLSTGVNPDHPDLKNLTDTFQFVNPEQPMKDAHGLGTQAAILCAGAGQSVYGVAPDAQLLIAKIGEQDHTIQPEDLLAGVEWAMNVQADIIAMLVDFPEWDTALMDRMNALVQQALARDILLLAPVGNSEGRKPESRYPASLEGVFSVGAHDRFGQRCGFSAKSFQLDILAPGEGLLISSAEGKPGVNSKSVAIATAFAAGFSALLLQWLRQKGEKSSPDVIFTLLRETAAARRNFNPGEDVEYGYGLLDPIAVLKHLDPAHTGAS